MRKINPIFNALWLLILLIPFLTLGNGNTAVAAPTPQMIPANFTHLAEIAKPGVVNIRTEKTVKGGGRVFRHFFGQPFGNNRDPFEDFFGPFTDKGPNQEFKQRSLGSGFIIDADGYIVTNNHVVEDADKIKVRLTDEKEFDAEVVGRDPNTDLALIKIKSNEKLYPLPLGDSESLDVGTWVVAIGSPFGLEQTVTAGIVSAKGRVIGSGPYDDFIQTDASINPGNSGGPLLNMDGAVVGINTAIVAQGQGIGFAIPINQAKRIVAQLKEAGEVTRGWLGVSIQDLTKEMADYYGVSEKTGVFVVNVTKGDPADKAGIKANDVILRVDGRTVKTGRELSMAVADMPVGKKVAVDLVRDGKEKTVMVTLGKRPTEITASEKKGKPEQEEGLELTDLTPENAQHYGLDETDTGVLVTDVDENSKPGQAGIQAGDLIQEINHISIESLADYRSQMSKIKSGDTVSMLIKRRNFGFVIVKFEK
jgi:serine protease Do